MAVQVVGSKMPTFASDALKPSKAGYGQNGFGGPSSDTPGERTASGFLPGPDLPAARATDEKIRNRAVSSKPIMPSFGMTSRTPRNK